MSDRPVEAAVSAAIDWLCRHQEPDGRWDADRFVIEDEGKGLARHDVPVTSLVMLVLAAEADAGRASSLTRAADWLVKQQGSADAPPGVIGPVLAHDWIYGHALSTLALLEASAILGEGRWRPAAAQAVAYLQSHRNPQGAWRYQPRDQDNDSSVTSWCISALVTARSNGLPVTSTEVAEPLEWLARMTDEKGGCGYTRSGEASSRQSIDHAKEFPPEKTAALAACALYARLQGGADPGARIQRAAAELILAKPARWQKDGSIDLYYWFHASQAMTQMPAEIRAKWFTTLNKTLLGSQRKGDEFAGSWDPVDAWSHEGGRFYVTAMAALCLQAPYRVGDLQALAQLPRTAVFAALRAQWGRKHAAARGEIERLGRTKLAPEHAHAVAMMGWYLDIEEQLAELAKKR